MSSRYLYGVSYQDVLGSAWAELIEDKLLLDFLGIPIRRSMASSIARFIRAKALAVGAKMLMDQAVDNGGLFCVKVLFGRHANHPLKSMS